MAMSSDIMILNRGAVANPLLAALVLVLVCTSLVASGHSSPSEFVRSGLHQPTILGGRGIHG